MRVSIRRECQNAILLEPSPNRRASWPHDRSGDRRKGETQRAKYCVPNQSRVSKNNASAADWSLRASDVDKRELNFWPALVVGPLDLQQPLMPII